MYHDFDGLTSDQWLIWQADVLNKALLKAAKLPLPRSGNFAGPSVELELDLSHDAYNTSDLSEEKDLKRYMDEIMAHETENKDIFFALHMPPRVKGEKLQPFATSNDDSVTLPRGQIVEVKAKVTIYRKKDSRYQRCDDGPSLYSWQVRES